MSQNPELLNPERLADIRTAADAIPEWVTACDNVESLMQGGELHPAIVHRARLLAHLDAREAQVREVLAGLLEPPAYPTPEPGERTYALHPESQKEVRDARSEAHRQRIRAAANTLAIDL